MAQRLGVEFLDRAIPTRVADRLGCTLDDALAHDESLGDAIGRLASSFALLPELAGAMVQAGVFAGEDYRRETETLIREHAAEGGAVILGRAAAVDPARPPGRGARAPRRPAAAPRRAGDGARGLEVRRRTAAPGGDRAREAYVRHFYGCDARDPALYHLVIDSTRSPGDRRRSDRGRGYALNSGRITPRASVWNARLKPTKAGETSSLSRAFHVERVDGEDVPVRRVALRRGRAAPRLLAVVVAHMERALGQLAAAAGAARELGRAGRQVDEQPVPEAAVRGRVGIEAGDHEALRLLRETGPAQVGRMVGFTAGHRRDEALVHQLTVFDLVALERERRLLREQVVRVRRLRAFQ